MARGLVAGSGAFRARAAPATGKPYCVAGAVPTVMLFTTAVTPGTALAAVSAAIFSVSLARHK